MLVFCAALVCLTTCGFVSGNRARLSERAASPSLRPLDIYIYVFGSQSCRIRRAQKGSARLGPTKLRFCSKTLFLWAFRSAFGLAPQNAARFSAGIRPRTCPRLAFSSALGAPSRPSSLAPAPQAASPAPSIADSRRLALSLAFSLSLVGQRSSPCAAPRRAWREPNPPASLSSLIGPRRRASLVPHEANAPHVLPGAHTGFSPHCPARLALGKKENVIKESTG